MGMFSQWVERADVAASKATPWPEKSLAESSRPSLQGMSQCWRNNGRVQAMLKRSVGLEQVARKHSYKKMIEGYVTWESTRIAGAGF